MMVSKDSHIDKDNDEVTFRPSGLVDDDNNQEEPMEVDEVTGTVTFEEILLLRLTFELNRSTKEKRTQYYLDRLEEIVPEIDDYRKITFALASMDEPDLPFIDPK